MTEKQLRELVQKWRCRTCVPIQPIKFPENTMVKIAIEMGLIEKSELEKAIEYMRGSEFSPQGTGSIRFYEKERVEKVMDLVAEEMK